MDHDILNPTKTKFRPATINDYISWLCGYVQRCPNAYLKFKDESFKSVKQDFVVALQDFTTGCECGRDARNIIVPRGVKYFGNNGWSGHNVFYFEDGYKRCMFGEAVVFNDPEFREFGFGAFIDKSRRETQENEKLQEVLNKYRRIYGNVDPSGSPDLDEATLLSMVSDLGVYLVACEGQNVTERCDTPNKIDIDIPRIVLTLYMLLFLVSIVIIYG